MDDPSRDTRLAALSRSFAMIVTGQACAEALCAYWGHTVFAYDVYSRS